MSEGNGNSESESESAERSRPAALSASVAEQMRRMPRKNTTPELRVRRVLHRLGYRYRLHPRLPGSPDIVFTRVRLAVFIDGCFWHACPEHGVLPKNNREWWRVKLARNADRDREKDEALAQLGWQILHIWEHEDAAQAAARIIDCYGKLVVGPRADSM